MEILFVARIAVDILFPGRSRKKIGTESRKSFRKKKRPTSAGRIFYVRKKLVNQDNYFIVFHFDGSRTDG